MKHVSACWNQLIVQKGRRFQNGYFLANALYVLAKYASLSQQEHMNKHRAISIWS